MFIYLKVLITFFQKNCIVYNTKAQWLVDINVRSWRILFHFCWVSIFFDVLILDMSWAVGQALANHLIFRKTNFRINIYKFLWKTYIYCWNLSIKLQKMLSFRNLKTIIQEINMATTLRDFTIDIWLTFKDHVDMSWSTTSYNSGVPREGSRGRGAWGASPLGMFSVLFWSLFPFKTIMLLKVFYNFTKFLHDFL